MRFRGFPVKMKEYHYNLSFNLVTCVLLSVNTARLFIRDWELIYLPVQNSTKIRAVSTVDCILNIFKLYNSSNVAILCEFYWKVFSTIAGKCKLVLHGGCETTAASLVKMLFLHKKKQVITVYL